MTIAANLRRLERLEQRIGGHDAEYDIRMEKLIAERVEAARRLIELMEAAKRHDAAIPFRTFPGST